MLRVSSIALGPDQSDGVIRRVVFEHKRQSTPPETEANIDTAYTGSISLYSRVIVILNQAHEGTETVLINRQVLRQHGTERKLYLLKRLACRPRLPIRFILPNNIVAGVVCRNVVMDRQHKVSLAVGIEDFMGYLPKAD